MSGFARSTSAMRSEWGDGFDASAVAGYDFNFDLTPINLGHAERANDVLQLDCSRTSIPV